ncbi:SUKH-3 domain-containing protein [Acinetobacter pittii]
MQESNFDLNANIEEYLINCGWYKGRKTDIEHTVEAWKADKYKIFNSAIVFVQSFNGLNIAHEAYRGKEKDFSYFNSIKATEGIDPAWIIEEYSLKAGNDLLPIGFGYSEHLTYFIDPSFKFYGGYDDYFCKIGDSVNSFFNNIFYEKNFIQL